MAVSHEQRVMGSLSWAVCVLQLSSKRRHSFKAAVNRQQGRGQDACRHRGRLSRFSPTCLSPACLFNAMVRRIAKEFLTDDVDRQYYADNYRCWPPPLFMPAITMLEVSLNLFASWKCILSIIYF